MLTDLRAITGEHLRLLDEHAPGLVTALLITGSISLGDYRPGVSDIDFVAIMEAEPTPSSSSPCQGSMSSFHQGRVTTASI